LLSRPSERVFTVNRRSGGVWAKKGHGSLGAEMTSQFLIMQLSYVFNLCRPNEFSDFADFN